MRDTRSGSAAAAEDPTLHGLADDAAREVVDDWDTQVPIIEGLVGRTLAEDNCTVVTVFQGGKDRQWRVSRGGYYDADGHLLQVAVRLPEGKTKRRGDVEHAFDQPVLIVDSNVNHVAASIVGGMIINNDNELTSVLPHNPVGFTKLFKDILRDSEEKATEARENRERIRSYKWGSVRGAVGKLALLAGLAASVIAGGPKIMNEYDEWDTANDERNAALDAQAAAEQAAQAEANRVALENFDAQFPEIQDGAVLEDGTRTYVPSTRQFVMAEEIPAYDVAGSPSQLEHVRSLPAPEMGYQAVYSLPIPEGAEFTIAHTGDGRLLVTAIIDKTSQTITIDSLDIMGSEAADAAPIAPGEIVITFR